MDATDVGQAVVDLLEIACLRYGLQRLKITSGEREHYADGNYRVPKRDLIAKVQVLQRGWLGFASGVRYSLVRQMREMRVKALPRDHQAFAAESGQHET